MIKRLTLAAAAGVSAQANDKAAAPTVMTPQQHFEMMQQHHQARAEQLRELHQEFVAAQQEAYKKLAETASYRTMYPTPEQMEAHAEAQQALIENRMEYQAKLHGMPSPKAIEAQMEERRAAWLADIEARDAARAKARDARRAAWDAETKRVREWNEKQQDLHAPWMKQHREMMEKHQAEMRAWFEKQRAERAATGSRIS